MESDTKEADFSANIELASVYHSHDSRPSLQETGLIGAFINHPLMAIVTVSMFSMIAVFIVSFYERRRNTQHPLARE